MLRTTILAGKKALFENDPNNEKSYKPGGPDEFIGAFTKQLQKSPYWSGLKTLNASDNILAQTSSTAPQKIHKVAIDKSGCP